MSHFALAIGSCTENKAHQIIECYYPEPLLSPADSLVTALQTLLTIPDDVCVVRVPQTQLENIAALMTTAGHEINAAFCTLAMESESELVLTLLPSDTKPLTVAEAYLKLHLLSHRLVKPHHINLDGLFAVLRNIAWTNLGPIDLPELLEWQMLTRVRGQTLHIFSVDKFPKMVDYVVPSGVRIADTARVRLGAYLGAGTTVMHEGFVNFNAGTAGTSMVEGRISAGVLVGLDSDIGGGASVMGTLSGGGKTVISVGDNCLVGANAGIGISLGDRCIVEAGLYVTAGTKVTLVSKDQSALKTVKAQELSGQSDLLFIRNSITGGVECRGNKTTVSLNEILHQNH